MPARFLLHPGHPLRGLSTPLRYVAATGVVAAFAAVRWYFDPYLTALPFLMFFPAVLLCAFCLDRGTGYFAGVLSTLVALYLFVPPRFSLRIEHSGDLIGACMFLAIVLFTSWLIEGLRQLSIQLDREHREKDTLLAEVNHRTKNNLHMATSLLLLHAAKVTDASAKQAFQDATQRLRVVAQLHETLYGTGKVAWVDTRGFVEDICSALQLSYIGSRPIAVRVHAESWDISMDRAVPMALIVNELVTNALKHAFPNGRTGSVDVTLERREGTVCLTVLDDGVGFEGRAADGLGAKLVPLLAQQLGGRLDYVIEGGTRAVVTFPLDPNAKPLRAG